MKILLFFFKYPVMRYLSSGGIGAVINLSILYFLTDVVGIYYILSSIIAFLISLVVSYTLQRKWTFKHKNISYTHEKFIIFTIIAIINLGANTILLYTFTDIVGIHYIISQIFSMGIIAIWSYFLYKIIIFSSNTDKI